MEEVDEIVAVISIVEEQGREVNRPDDCWEEASAREEGDHEEVHCCEEKPEEDVASEEDYEVDYAECNVEDMRGDFRGWERLLDKVRERREPDDAEYHQENVVAVRAPLQIGNVFLESEVALFNVLDRMRFVVFLHRKHE